MSEFIDALQKSKGTNELNILRNVIDKSTMEKARTVGQLGETRTWGGKEYIKTAKGWRPKPKGGSKEGSGTLEEKKVPGAPENFHFVGASDEGWPKGSSNIHHALDVMGGPKYSDPSKVSLDYDDKYGWSVSYDGKEVGSLSKNAISKEDAKAAGWYKEGQDSAKEDTKESANDKSQKESSAGDQKKKKLTIKEQDSQNVSKIQGVLKDAGIKDADIKVHRWDGGKRTYDYVGAGRNPYRFSLNGDTGQFTLTWGTQDALKGDINNEEHVKAVRNHIKGNDILNKMRDALKGDQKNMTSLIKELQELF